MGACTSIICVFEVRPNVPGQTEMAKNIIQNLLLFDDPELDKYFTIFTSFDTGNTGQVNIDTYLQSLGINTATDSKSFRRLLNFFDLPQSRNEFNFLEWIFNFWNLLTLPDTEYAAFVYALAENMHGSLLEKTKREISTTSLLQVLKDLEGLPFEKDGPEHKKIKDLYPNFITEINFLSYAKDHYRDMFRILPRTLGDLKKKYMGGNTYWKDEIYRRKIAPSLQSPRLLTTLIELVADDKQEVERLFKNLNDQAFLDARDQAKAKPHKRRESKLLNAFKVGKAASSCLLFGPHHT